jgi:hypothetical protein
MPYQTGDAGLDPYTGQPVVNPPGWNELAIPTAGTQMVAQQNVPVAPASAPAPAPQAPAPPAPMPSAPAPLPPIAAPPPLGTPGQGTYQGRTFSQQQALNAQMAGGSAPGGGYAHMEPYPYSNPYNNMPSGPRGGWGGGNWQQSSFLQELMKQLRDRTQGTSFFTPTALSALSGSTSFAGTGAGGGGQTTVPAGGFGGYGGFLGGLWGALGGGR